MKRATDSIQNDIEQAEPYIHEIEKSPKRVSQKDALIQLVLDEKHETEFFHDQSKDAYVTLHKEGHYETWPVRNIMFRLWVQHLFWKNKGQSISSQALEEALKTFESIAIHEGNAEEVFIRSASRENELYIDLGRKDWQCVKITPDGWRVGNFKHIKFVRTGGTGEIPLPETGGSIDDLKLVLNVQKEGDFMLIVAWMLAALRPGYAYPLLVVQGEQGTGKTFCCQRIRELIDPNQSLLRAMPSNELDLITSARSNLVLAYDNISFLNAKMSDALCRVSTGGGLAKRALYSDMDEIVADVQRPQLINGIEDIAARPDLNERAIIINLAVIPKEQRRDTEELLEQFKQIRPKVFGALCDGLSAALSNIDNTVLESKPRMADFAKFVTAAESAFGWQHLSIMHAYEESRNDALENSIETNTLVKAVTEFMAARLEFEGTMGTLLGYLKEHVDPDEARHSNFPKTSSYLSQKLKRDAPLLRKANIEYINGVKTEQGRMVILRNL